MHTEKDSTTALYWDKYVKKKKALVQHNTSPKKGMNACKLNIAIEIDTTIFVLVTLALEDTMSYQLFPDHSPTTNQRRNSLQV